ncbi:MAG: b(o/a)3-type cytochrome-c oxidase subunit 1 [Deltaproteobacteria bacterium]|nr:b(o/a)3-type cytochrome-c oxidase subunit 1 [Deltaproteobacteria bacterium]
MFAGDDRLVRWHLFIAFVALAIGGLFGPLQALNRMGISLYPVLGITYYQGLTLHGVLVALVWTTFFICGFLVFVTVRSLDQPLTQRAAAWIAFWLMLVGVGAAGYAILTNQATVLYTFYPPLRAHPAFYIGLTLVVVGTWILSAVLFMTYRRWRGQNPAKATPFMAFAALVTFILWDIATIGVAAEMLFQLIPWSLGWIGGIDALLARTLFWYFGHPLVYFWLLPAYLSWYAMLPKQAGGRLFSDPMARLAFLLLLVFSVPVGFHHQFADPGIGHGWKGLHTILTFSVAFPSLLTAFNVIASLEIGGRARGGTGLFGWILRLPWGEPSFAAQALAILLFAFGGVGGFINASYNLNLIVHNTAWVPGHLHLTVGSAVTLTFAGIAYWLIPLLTGRQLWHRGLALAQVYLWFFGMALFSFGMHWAGVLGQPRRTDMATAVYRLAEWEVPDIFTGVGGVILFLSLILLIVEVALTAFFARRAPVAEMPLARRCLARLRFGSGSWERLFLSVSYFQE